MCQNYPLKLQDTKMESQSCPATSGRLTLAPMRVPDFNANYSEQPGRELNSALAFASQTYMMLPNLNQYLFFLSKLARPSASACDPHSPTSKLNLNQERSENRRRRKLGGDSESASNQSDLETTLNDRQQVDKSAKQRVSTRIHPSAKERFREVGAILREISDQFHKFKTNQRIS